jgi:hypothetical protein
MMIDDNVFLLLYGPWIFLLLFWWSWGAWLKTREESWI